jgi:hypothetical protein
VPWCATCDRFLAPPTVLVDGTCPTCGRPVEVGDAATRRDRDLPPVPWHFKVLVGGLTVYLGYRAWQGVEWVRHTLAH